MDRRAFLGALGLLAGPAAAEAQAAAKIYRIGLLAGGSAAATAFVRAAILGGLSELGYRECETVMLAERYANNEFGRLPELAADLVRLNVNLILTSTTPAALAAKAATATIPIVVVTGGDLVGARVVASLARPGGNVTGLSFLGTELAVKQMELLKRVAPAIRRVVFLGNGAIQPEVLFYEDIERAARKLGVSTRFADARTLSDVEAAFAGMTRDNAQGLVVAPNVSYIENRQAIVDLAARARLPAVYQSREFAESGGLLSYGINRPAFFRRSAVYVDKILKGAKPGDLPVEQPTQFELVVNLRTAKALRLSLPPSLLQRADQVIE